MIFYINFGYLYLWLILHWFMTLFYKSMLSCCLKLSVILSLVANFTEAKPMKCSSDKTTNLEFLIYTFFHKTVSNICFVFQLLKTEKYLCAKLVKKWFVLSIFCFSHKSEAVFHLMVYPLFPTIKIDMGKTLYKPGENIVVPCEITAYPPPNIGQAPNMFSRIFRMRIY